MGRRTLLAMLVYLGAGRGISLVTARKIALSALTGVVVGFVCVAFRTLIGFALWWFVDILGASSPYSQLTAGSALTDPMAVTPRELPLRLAFTLLPALGALAGYLLLRAFRLEREALGTDSAVAAYHRRNGKMRLATIPVKMVASVLTVASGGSAGFEGPVTVVGGACGSVVAQALKLDVKSQRILMAAGMAAGIAALFQAPLAGAIFGFEVFYSSADVEYETAMPSFVAAAFAYAVFGCFFGWDPLFVSPVECAFANGWRLLPYLALALVIVFGARFYILTYRAVAKGFLHWSAPAWLKVFTGGLVTGILGYFCPDILGAGYRLIQAGMVAGFEQLMDDIGPLSAAAFVLFFFLKTIATSFTVGSGGSGGLFAPAIVCGGTLGAAVGMVFRHFLPPELGINPASFALVGMAGFLASAIRVPLTAIVIVAEISGNHRLLLPAILVCGISFWLNSGWALYRSQPRSRRTSPLHLGE